MSQWEVKGELESCILQRKAEEPDFILDPISHTSGLFLVIVVDHLPSLIILIYCKS